jgi:rare lipoprotein A
MKMLLLAVILLTVGGNRLSAQSPADSIRKVHAKTPVPDVQTGVASYYHSKFNGRLTASGEIYDQAKMTAAHNRLPLGTRIRVTNLRNKRTIVVKVNDRLHHRNTRLVDLSRAAAAALGYVGRGLTRVKVEVLKD